MRSRALLFSLALTACTAPPVRQQAPEPEQAPSTRQAPAPAAPSAPAVSQASADWQWYQNARQTGQRVWQIDSQASLIVVTVRRGGPMARLGHDHVVASRSVQGYVAPDAGRADFQFRLDQLQVDDTQLRQEAGLTTVPSAEAVDGTRTNMLTRVLDAEHYPVVAMHVDSLDGQTVPVDGVRPMRLRIRLHGAERTLDVPTTLATNANELVASGSFVLNQSDFGITPMSVLGGAIVVMDQMELRFRLVAGPR